MATCSNCMEDKSAYAGDDYLDDGWYCDYCINNNLKLRERISNVKKRNDELGHTDSDMCGCSMCAAKFEREN